MRMSARQCALIGLALVTTMFRLSFATFMMLISIEAVSRELEDAAQVDCAGTFGVFRKVRGFMSGANKG